MPACPTEDSGHRHCGPGSNGPWTPAHPQGCEGLDATVQARISSPRITVGRQVLRREALHPGQAGHAWAWPRLQPRELGASRARLSTSVLMGESPPQVRPNACRHRGSFGDPGASGPAAAPNSARDPGSRDRQPHPFRLLRPSAHPSKMRHVGSRHGVPCDSTTARTARQASRQPRR